MAILKKDSLTKQKNIHYIKNMIADAKAGTLKLQDGTVLKGITHIETPAATANGTAKYHNITTVNATTLRTALSTIPKGKFPYLVKKTSTNQVSWNILGTKGVDKDSIKDDRGTAGKAGKAGKDGAYPMGNRGGIAEGVYAAAIFLRFTADQNSRAKTIREDDLKNFIFSKMNKSNTGEVKGLGPNRDTTKKDNICLTYGLKLKDWKCLADKRLWPHWKNEKHVKIDGYKEIKKTGHDMIGAALNYVNGIAYQKSGQPDSVRAWAHTFWNNGVVNDVIINAEGEKAQDETKVDIRVSANNHDGDMVDDILRISLKYGGVGQFGQMSGVTWDITADVFKEWFGFTDNEIAYREADFKSDIIRGKANNSHKSDAANAMFKMWERQRPAIEKQIQTKKGVKAFSQAFYKHISQGKKATEFEAGVTLVDAVKTGSKIYNLDKLKDIDFTGHAIKTTWEILEPSSRSGKVSGFSHMPKNLCQTTISGIIGGKEQDIVRIRIKRGDSNEKGPYYRTIFEKQHGLDDLILEAERTWDSEH